MAASASLDADQAEETDEGTDDSRAPAPRRWGRALAILATLLVLLVGVAAGTVWYIADWLDKSSLENNVTRIDDVFDRKGLPDAGPRPEASPTGALNILILGSDSRGPAATGSEGQDDIRVQSGHRTDTMMLLHIPKDRQSVRAVSLPRDSWVTIPGRGEAKLNAAFSWGGPKLLAATVENLVGVRVDHYVAVDFEGFKTMVDTLGGVTVDKQPMSGDEALGFVRQRYGLPRGDFDRIVHQQQVLSGIVGKLSDEGVLNHPVRTKEVLESLTKSITADEAFDMEKMKEVAGVLAKAEQSGLEFRTLPNNGSGWRGQQSVVELDDARCQELFGAIRRDTAWPEAKKGETWKP